MSIYEGTREPVNLDTLFEELNKLGTSASLKLAYAIEEHTEYHLDPSDGYLRDNCPPYKGAIPIAEVSRNFGIDMENVYIYVYILERHVVFVTTDVNHDCVGKVAAVPVTEIYALTRLLDRLSINVDDINHLMEALIMSGKEGWVYVRKFTQRRTKFYEEGMKGVATMLDKKVIGSLAACVKALDQEMEAVKSDPYYEDVERISSTILEYKANKETGHPIYFRVEYVALKVTDYPLLDY